MSFKINPCKPHRSVLETLPLRARVSQHDSHTFRTKRPNSKRQLLCGPTSGFESVSSHELLFHVTRPSSRRRLRCLTPQDFDSFDRRTFRVSRASTLSGVCNIVTFDTSIHSIATATAAKASRDSERHFTASPPASLPNLSIHFDGPTFSP